VNARALGRLPNRSRSLPLLPNVDILDVLHQAFTLMHALEPHLHEGRLSRDFLELNRIFTIHPLQERQKDASDLLVSWII
jgi:hypothetical protein